jgi:hypothetical protein
MAIQLSHPCKKIIFKKNPLQETKFLQDFITLLSNVKFKCKPKFHLSKNPRPMFHSWFSIEGFRVFEDHPCVLLLV